MPRARSTPRSKDSTAHLGFVAKLWLAADKVRNNMDAAEYSGATWTLPKERPQGERGGVHQFYTPSCVVRLLVEMLAPYKGRIYDPACGSGGSLPARRLRRIRSAQSGRAIAPRGVQSEKFVESHGGQLGDISIYGQDKRARRQRPFGLVKRARRVRLRRQQPKQSNPTTRRLAIMNLALRGIEADFGPENADTFRRDLHPDLRADFPLANPPFNDSDWHREDDDIRWQSSGTRQSAKGNPQGERGGVHQFDVPPRGNGLAKFAIWN